LPLVNRRGLFRTNNGQGCVGGVPDLRFIRSFYFMGKDIVLIITEFRNVTSLIYEMVFAGFRESVKNLDRQEDENVYQQLQSKYRSKLKMLLEHEAEKILEEHRAQGDLRMLQRELNGHVSYLLTAFLLKAKSM